MIPEISLVMVRLLETILDIKHSQIDLTQNTSAMTWTNLEGKLYCTRPLLYYSIQGCQLAYIFGKSLKGYL